MPVGWRLRCALAFVLLAAAAAAGWGESDYAVIRVARSGAAVQVVHRLAIIGWNGQEEVIILATSFSAGGEATVLQAFPLPDIPSQIAAVKRESLWAVQGMVADRDPRRRTAGGGDRPSRPGPLLPVSIPWYDPTPARDRTVITPKDADAFLSEAAAFAVRQGGRLSAGDGVALRAMAARYLRAGYHHFMLEAADLKRGVYMVGPTSYRFRSDRLFCPIFPTAPGAPPPQSQLLLLTRFEPQAQALPPGLRPMPYQGGGSVGFVVSRRDVLRLSATVARLFVESDEVVLTGVERWTSGRARDLVLRDEPQPASPRHQVVSRPPPEGRSGGSDGLAAARELHRPPEAAVVHSLAWSPAGDRLCVVELRMPPGQEPVQVAVLLDLAKGSRKEVALSGWLSSQGWSPDGTQLSFLDTTGNVQVVDVDRDWARQVTGFTDHRFGGRPGEAPAGWSPPAWSASGRWLAFGAFANLWVVGRDGRGLRQLTHIAEADGSSPGGRGGGRGVGRSGGGGGFGMRRGAAPALPHSWSPRGEVLAYGQPEAEGDTWSVQGCEPETGRPVSVRGDLGLIGVRTLIWQPGGGQLAVLAAGPSAEQTIYLIPTSGPIKELASDLPAAKAMWTGDGRTLLVRGAASGTQRLTVRAVEAARGAVRTLAPTHFLADRDVVIAVPRPGSEDIAFALGTEVYLARADGSGWRRLDRAGRVTVRRMANPLERWQRDPVVLEAARRWQRATSRSDDRPSDDLIYGVWDGFLDRWKARLLAGERVTYRDLPEDLRREVLTGLAYQTFRSTPLGADPAALTVPEWYWWLDEARLGLGERDPSSLFLTVEGPDGAAHAFVISRPQSSGRPVRSAIPRRLWWPALFGAAAAIVALVGWWQARRQRESPLG